MLQLPLKQQQWLHDMDTIYSSMIATESKRKEEIKNQKMVITDWLENICGHWQMGEIGAFVQQLHFAGWQLPKPPQSLKNDRYFILRYKEYIEKWLHERYDLNDNVDMFDLLWNDDFASMHPLVCKYRKPSMSKSGKMLIKINDILWQFEVGDNITVWCPNIVVDNELSTSLCEDKSLRFKIEWEILVKIIHDTINQTGQLLKIFIDIIADYWLGIVSRGSV